MCDCYDHKCELCDEMLPIHIGDFRYGREELKVFCQKHLPKYNATIFTATTPFKHIPTIRHKDEEKYEIPGTQIAISLRNGKLEPENEDVHPNIFANSDIKILPRKF